MESDLEKSNITDAVNLKCEEKNYYKQCLILQRCQLLCTSYFHIRGCADKSVARPNSRCLRTESIVSLERGVCSCAELQVFFLITEAKRKHVRRRARFQQHRDANSLQVPPPHLQGKAPREIHVILK